MSEEHVTFFVSFKNQSNTSPHEIFLYLKLSKKKALYKNLQAHKFVIRQYHGNFFRTIKYIIQKYKIKK